MHELLGMTLVELTETLRARKAALGLLTAHWWWAALVKCHSADGQSKARPAADESSRWKAVGRRMKA